MAKHGFGDSKKKDETPQGCKVRLSHFAFFFERFISFIAKVREIYEGIFNDVGELQKINGAGKNR